MKKILCFFMVAFLAALLVVPCFAAETTVDRGGPVDWFGSQSLSGYSVSFTGNYYINTTQWSAFSTWLTSVGATSSSSAVGPFNVEGPSSAYSDQYLYIDGNSVYFGNGSLLSYIKPSSSPCVINSLDGLDIAQSFTDCTIDLYYTGSDGFVDSGFSVALTELSTIVTAILSNQYILIAIGLAVAVPLVAWGISKIKSLVKGY